MRLQNGTLDAELLLGIDQSNVGQVVERLVVETTLVGNEPDSDRGRLSVLRLHVAGQDRHARKETGACQRKTCIAKLLHSLSVFLCLLFAVRIIEWTFQTHLMVRTLLLPKFESSRVFWLPGDHSLGI